MDRDETDPSAASAARAPFTEYPQHNLDDMGVIIMKSLQTLCLTAVAALILAPTTMAGGRNPGSVLVFPVQRSGPQFTTIVSVTNTNVVPMSPVSLGGATMVHYEYANTIFNPDDAQIPLGCVIFDRYEFLTPADTLSVLTTCHNAINPGGQEGYLVVSAQNPTMWDNPWDFNWLMGSELVINASGGMYSVNAIPFKGLVGPGLSTDLNGNSALDFDGLEYEGVADTLFIDSFVALGGSQLALVNLTGGAFTKNVLGFEVWNDNEYPMSTTKVMGCWFDQPLVNVSPLFDEAFLKNNTPHDPTELDLTCNGVGTIETGWVRINSLGVFLPSGSVFALDGAVVGCITAGATSVIDGGHLLWESDAVQFNGKAFEPSF
jgi:hypothetical protein